MGAGRGAAIRCVVLPIAIACAMGGCYEGTGGTMCLPAGSTPADGVWTIRGDGQRRGCEDNEYNSRVELRLGRPLLVVARNHEVRPPSSYLAAPRYAPAATDAADVTAPVTDPVTSPVTAPVTDPATVTDETSYWNDYDDACPWPTRGDLVLADVPTDLPQGLEVFFSGHYDRGNVSFVLLETDTTNGAIRLQFSGQTDGEQRIRGRFTGSGPGTCQLSGDFDVRIR